MPQRNFVTHPLVRRELTVSRVVDVTPRMRRVTLTGPQLQEFKNSGFDLPEFVSTGFDDHVKLVFADGGPIAEALPIQRAHSIDWTDSGVTLTRDYTPRRFDAALGELELDFVRHGDGPAATWAEAAAVGDSLHIVGPKSSLVLPSDVEWMLLAGDETALPAIGRYLDERPGDVPAIVVASSGAESALVGAVMARELPAGTGYVWVAGESRSLLPLRRWCARDRGMPKTHVNITGYWHATEQAAQAVPVLETADAARQHPLELDELLSPVPWFAARAALSTGLLDAVASTPRPIAALAGDLALDEGGVRALVQALAAFDAVRVSAGLVALGPAGDVILEDEHLRESLDDTVEAELLLSLAHLADSLRTGRPPYVTANGATLRRRSADSFARLQEQVEAAIGFDFVARGVTGLQTLREAHAVAVTGPGSVAFSNAFAGATRVTVVGSLLELDAARKSQPGSEFEAAESFGATDADVVASALALAQRTDEEAVAFLTRLAERAGAAVIIELVQPESSAPSAHAAEHALLAYAATGTPPRSLQDLESLATRAGWRLVRATPLGWDHEALELQRPPAS
ncbi:siderophore-interacting protein [Pseudoclavibacter helvolus]|uniref:siderophore-interacting protein n=1 Tax=Pseudoclavibacter helvolus TaxID=255205 RepID=UPI00083836CC|nr:siderophore-interacting protein [Pseudoclavibacter helvolus]